MLGRLTRLLTMRGSDRARLEARRHALGDGYDGVVAGGCQRSECQGPSVRGVNGRATGNRAEEYSEQYGAANKNVDGVRLCTEGRKWEYSARARDETVEARRKLGMLSPPQGNSSKRAHQIREQQLFSSLLQRQRRQHHRCGSSAPPHCLPARC